MVSSHALKRFLLVIRFDAGSFDQEIFVVLEDLGVGYTCTATFYIPVSTVLSRNKGQEFAGSASYRLNILR